MARKYPAVCDAYVEFTDEHKARLSFGTAHDIQFAQISPPYDTDEVVILFEVQHEGERIAWTSLTLYKDEDEDEDEGAREAWYLEIYDKEGLWETLEQLLGAEREDG